ncbi:MAG: DUF1127 domain-containing protein [Pseudomonadota bacterium]
MSACTTDLMTNHHHDFIHHPVTAISDVLHTWQQRSKRRAELAHLSDRDFHDVGASWSDFAHEASKPFWRA